jgi:hypothetical protein
MTSTARLGRLRLSARTIVFASANNTIGRRLQDISAEGALGRDVFAATGGLNRADVLALNDICVTGGALDLALKADADHPSIAGIEVFCRAAC